jgi:hypothetical protein
MKLNFLKKLFGKEKPKSQPKPMTPIKLDVSKPRKRIRYTRDKWGNLRQIITIRPTGACARKMKRARA